MNRVESSKRRPLALVTGASSGIGTAFAAQLAREGFDLLLVARREDRLRELADRLAEAHGVEVRIDVTDLSSTAEVERLASTVRGLEDLDLLVNNAGFGTSSYFHDADLGQQLDMIHVHVVAAVMLTHAALAGMLARRRGSIINVSSVAAWIARPGNTNYSATKAYLTTFTESLSNELRGTGVRVQALCPGMTYTEFHDTPQYAHFDRARIPGFVWMTADEVVSRSLRGLESKRAVLIPGWQNRIIVTLAKTRLGRWVMRSSRFGLRNRKA